MIDKNKITYFQNLDGLRTVAAFSVIFCHISQWFKYPIGKRYEVLKFILSYGEDGGNLGVVFFFILSGFLITYLMFVEKKRNGKLNIFYFYIRRILRIWPLYYLTLIVGFLIYPLILKIFGIVYIENSNSLLYILFLTNFDYLYNGFPKNEILGVQWSVAIEEQFYLIWPIIFYLFCKKKVFPFIMVTLIFISELFVIYSSNGQITYFHTLSCFRFLSFGGLLGYICYFKTEWVEFCFQKINKIIIFLIYSCCLILILFQKEFRDMFFFYKYLYHILPCLFFGFVIVEQNFSINSFFKMGSFHLLSWLGKISYGLYLTHMIAIYIIIGIFPKSTDYIILKIVSSVLLTIIISYFSYYYFELFFLSLKNKFSIISMNYNKKYFTKKK